MSGQQSGHPLGELLSQMAELLSAHGIDTSMLSGSSVGARSSAYADRSSSPEAVPPSGAATAPPPASTALLSSSFHAATQQHRGHANAGRVPLEVPFVVSTTSATSPNLLRHFDAMAIDQQGVRHQHSALPRPFPGAAVTQLSFAPVPAPAPAPAGLRQPQEVLFQSASSSPMTLGTAATPVSGCEALSIYIQDMQRLQM